MRMVRGTAPAESGVGERTPPPLRN